MNLDRVLGLDALGQPSVDVDRRNRLNVSQSKVDSHLGGIPVLFGDALASTRVD